MTARLCFMPRHVIEVLMLEHISIKDAQIVVDKELLMEKVDNHELF